jgi:hypothetical protein
VNVFSAVSRSYQSRFSGGSKWWVGLANFTTGHLKMISGVARWGRKAPATTAPRLINKRLSKYPVTADYFRQWIWNSALSERMLPLPICAHPLKFVPGAPSLQVK